jgi:hypothetical protein
MTTQPASQKADLRLYEFDAKSRKNTAQYAYLLDPTWTQSQRSLRSMVYQQFNIKDQLLVVERSYPQEHKPAQ